MKLSIWLKDQDKVSETPVSLASLNFLCEALSFGYIFLRLANENKNIKSVHLIISGRVQGVGFRYSIKQIATRHHIKGWIRNRDDGRVEIGAEGTDQQVDAFIRKVGLGTFFARVEDIEIQTCVPQYYTTFDIKATM